MPTFLNGIQVVIEFNWNLKVDSRLHNKRFVSQARQTPHSREARDKREARCVRREEKDPNIFGSTFAKILNLNFRHIWRYLYPSFDLRFRRTLLTSPLAREEGGGGGEAGGEGDQVFKEFGGSVCLQVWLHVSRQWLSKWRAKCS